MNRNIEHEIEQTLNSLGTPTTAQASPFLFEKITNQMKNRNKVIAKISLKFTWEFAVILSLIAGLNVAACLNYDSQSQKIQANITLKQIVSQEYSDTDYYNF